MPVALAGVTPLPAGEASLRAHGPTALRRLGLLGPRDNPLGGREDDDAAHDERGAHFVDRLAETLERMSGATIEQDLMRTPAAES